MEYPEREPHDKSIINKNFIKNDENDDNNSIDYFSNEDEFLIIEEYNKQFNNENSDNNDDFNNENMNPDYEDDDEDKENEDDEDDRDQDFLSLKNNYKNSFLKYYQKFANEKLVLNLKQINEFKLFEIMMKDIELNDINILNDILDQVSKSERGKGKELLSLIEKYKGIQKIFFQNKNVFSYRKILKIKRK